MPLWQRAAAELVGTFWLVLGGCGSAVLAAAFPAVGIGLLGVSLAFGLTVLTMAFAIGHVSGCHLNPAVSVGLVVGGRFKASELPAYVVAQVVGAALAARDAVPHRQRQGGVLHRRRAGEQRVRTALARVSYSMGAGFLTEVVMTAAFLFVIMGATDERAPKGFAPIAIGLCLTLIHLVSIPVTNTSVNPARSTGPALVVGGWALEQLWLFWVAPIIGAALGALVYGLVAAPKATPGPAVART